MVGGAPPPLSDCRLIDMTMLLEMAWDVGIRGLAPVGGLREGRGEGRAEGGRVSGTPQCVRGHMSTEQGRGEKAVCSDCRTTGRGQGAAFKA